MANEIKIDIKNATVKKLEKNSKKYPVEKSKGKHLKYTAYQQLNKRSGKQ